MKMNLKATLVGTCVAGFSLIGSFLLAGVVRTGNTAQSTSATSIETSSGEVLFRASCARCHGNSAQGIDDAPKLLHLKITDKRITQIIKNGIKGQMPAFGKKYNDAEIDQIISYLRSL